jgi:hypothetical protein
MKSKIESDFEFYKNNLSKKLDEKSVNLMLHAYCMGYLEMAIKVSGDTEYLSSVVNPILEKISELGPSIKEYFI